MRGVSEESFRLIVETIPGLIAVMTTAGEVEHVNRRVLEYFGRTLDELKQWGTSDAVHPADLPRVKAAWQHAIETGLPYEFEHRIRRGDGEYRWFQSRGPRFEMSTGGSSAGTTCSRTSMRARKPRRSCGGARPICSKRSD